MRKSSKSIWRKLIRFIKKRLKGIVKGILAVVALLLIIAFLCFKGLGGIGLGGSGKGGSGSGSGNTVNVGSAGSGNGTVENVSNTGSGSISAASAGNIESGNANSEKGSQSSASSTAAAMIASTKELTAIETTPASQTSTNNRSTAVQAESSTAPSEEVKITSVSLEIRQGNYYIDGKLADLKEIEALVKNSHVVITIENNYGSQKAISNLQELYRKYNRSYVE